MTPDLSPRAQEALDKLVTEAAAQGRDPLESRAEALAFAQCMGRTLARMPKPSQYPTMPQDAVDVLTCRRRS